MTTKRALVQFQAFGDKTVQVGVPMTEWNNQEAVEEALAVFALIALDEWSEVAADFYSIKKETFIERVRMHLQTLLLDNRVAGG